MSAALIWHINQANIELSSAGIQIDDSLMTLVIIMLFTDRRALDDDTLPDRTNRRGWPGDTYFPYPIGSRLWLLSREKIVPRVLYDAKDYALEALDPLIQEGYAKDVSVEVSVWNTNWMRFDIQIVKPDDSMMSYSISKRWDAQAHAL
ncbi:phage GP46 family protein [Vibrio paucivorans]